MNKADRKEINKIKARIAAAVEELRSYAEAEQEKFDNVNENLQNGEKAQKMQEAADGLADICDNIESELEDIDQYLE